MLTRVLLVDDDPAIHRAVQLMLPAFQVTSAFDGPSALVELETALSQQREPALVILDVRMPGWGGLETLERLWRVEPDLQALLCTGGSLDPRELQLRFGDTDALLVINKPFSRVEVVQAAQALTTKWRLQRLARARLDELEAAVKARTTQLEAANTLLAEAIEWRDRIEADMRTSNRLEAVGQLASGIAHEINNPLQYVGDHLEFVSGAAADLLDVIGRLQTCLPEGEAPARDVLASIDLPYVSNELPGALDAIQDGVRRITSIVRSMKELAHPGTGDARVADINRALESALEISANTYRGVADLEKRLSPLPPVTCFIAELGQVFLNLIINAAHAMEGRPRGKLSVASERIDDHIVITIADTGSGIPPEIQQRIFDPFFTTKPIGRGTGQGLAIARSIVVERHAGELQFDTVAGCGTTFRVRIPIAGPAACQSSSAA